MSNTRIRNFNRVLLIITAVMLLIFGYSIQVLVSELQLNHFEEVGRNFTTFIQNILTELATADIEQGFVIASNGDVKDFVNEPSSLVYTYRAENFLGDIAIRIEDLESAMIIPYSDTDEFIGTDDEKHEIDVSPRYFDTHAYYMGPMSIDAEGMKYHYILTPIFRENLLEGVVSMKLGYSGFEQKFITDSNYQKSGIFMLVDVNGDILVQSQSSDMKEENINSILQIDYQNQQYLYDEASERYFYIDKVQFTEEEVIYFIFSQSERELFKLRRRIVLDTAIMIGVLLLVYLILSIISGKYFNHLISEDTKLVLEETVDKEVHEQTKVLRKQARRDSLTQIYNHAVLIEILEEAVLEGKAVSVLMIDIDYFKLVNDNHGHLIGDDVLVELSQLLLKSIRFEDAVGRYGGEEFMIILRETDIEVAYIIAERIRMDVMNHPFSELDLNITISLGLAELEDEDAMSLVKRADKYLYKSKESGRNMTTM